MQQLKAKRSVPVSAPLRNNRADFVIVYAPLVKRLCGFDANSSL